MQGRVFLQENHFYISGDEIKKLGPDTYQARRAQITTCDGPRPSWKITCRDIKVTVAQGEESLNTERRINVAAN